MHGIQSLPDQTKPYKTDGMVHIKVDNMADDVADMMVDMEVDKVADMVIIRGGDGDMEVDKEAGIAVDMDVEVADVVVYMVVNMEAD